MRRCPLYLLGFIGGAGLAVSATGVQPAAPLRVVLCPPVTNGPAAIQASLPLSRCLRERLAEIPEVSLATEGWTEALLDSLSSPALRPVDEADLYSCFTNVLPVDAVVQVIASSASGPYAALVHTRTGIRRAEFRSGDPDRAQKSVEAIGAWLAEQWHLPEPSARRLTERRIQSPAAFMAIYSDYSESTPLDAIQPSVNAPPDRIPLAAAMLRKLAVLLRDAPSDAEATRARLRLAGVALPHVLGTEHESDAYALLRLSPASFIPELSRLAAPLVDTVDLALQDGESDGAPPPGGPGAAIPLSRRLGALRCLAVARDPAAIRTIQACALSADPLQREAAATALQHHEGQAGLDLLATLASDKAPAVAFAASFSGWKRGRPSPALAVLARRFLDDPSRRARAFEAFVALAAADDIPRLRSFARDVRPDVREPARRVLARLQALTADEIREMLCDPSEDVEALALRNLPAQIDDGMRARLLQLANAPIPHLALAARLGLHAHRSADPRLRPQEELDSEHPAIRLMVIDELATNREPWAVEMLVRGCANPDAHARARALTRLAERAPDRARPLLAGAIGDPHGWVRLHAAAWLASLATAAESGAIRSAAASETDEAIALYLADAQARAGGRPAPPARPAAHSVASRTNLTWMVGLGEDCEASPFDAYYSFSLRPDEKSRRAHDRGKIIFARAGVINNLGAIVTHAPAMDRFWLALDRQLTSNNLPHIDGLVFGEECLGAHRPALGVSNVVFGAAALGAWVPPGSRDGWVDFCRPVPVDPERAADALWESGWTVFCRAAGLDPARVAGARANLTPAEARAWLHWAQCQSVVGFNELYDYVKLRYARLRPGLQVATFLPGRGGVSPNDRDWKFDVGGIADARGSSRIAAYTLVRRMKTLWPDRPVIWLGLGMGGLYDGRPVQHSREMPRAPVVSRRDRAYADAVSAWVAGADCGWLSAWNVLSPKGRPNTPHDIYHGYELHVEDIVPGGSRFEAALALAFRGLGSESPAPAKPGVAAPIIGEDSAEADAPPVAPGPPAAPDGPASRQVIQQKDQMRTGFLFCHKYVYDCARVFSSLRRLNPRPPALMVRPDRSAGSPAGALDAPGLTLLRDYDFLLDINGAPDADLPRYRLIAVDGLDDTPLTDRTVLALTGWLSGQPGLLYVHGTITTNMEAAVCTAADYSGVRSTPWPWAGQVSLSPDRTHYALAGSNARTLAAGPAGPTRVLWRGPGMKGAVLFDAEAGRMPELREAINALFREQQIGLAVDERPLPPIWPEAGMQGAAAADGAGTGALAGVDLLSCEPNPVTGPDGGAALVATNLIGRYVAAVNGIVARCDRPIRECQAVAGGIRIACDGLMQAGSTSGVIEVRTLSGHTLPKVAPELFNDWVLLGDDDGCAAPGGAGPVYIRCKAPVSIVATPSERRITEGPH